MSYGDKHGITKLINDKVNNLSIAYDSDDNVEDPTQRYPVFFYTPDMDNKNENFRIQLDYKEAEVLHQWLGDYLEDTYKCSDYDPTVEEMEKIFNIMVENHVNKKDILGGEIGFTEREIGVVYVFTETGSLERVSEAYFVTRERVRQILAKVKRKYNELEKENENS